jgi:putative redox protein
MVQLNAAGVPMRPAWTAHCLGNMGDFDEARPSGNSHISTAAADGTARQNAGAPAGQYAGAPAPAPEPGVAVRRYEVISTTCGRRITVGRLKLSGPTHPLGRITMNFGCEPHDHGQVWMSLTSSECRRLAEILLAQAASAERECTTGDDAATRPDGATAQVARMAPPPGRIEVAFLADETYAVHARGHHMLTDQPIKDGGRDVAATPTELFVASLASCVAFYAGRYLSRHGYSRDGLYVSAEFDMAARPARVGAVRLRIRVPYTLPDERIPGLLAVVSHCTVGNTLNQPPTVDIALA